MVQASTTPHPPPDFFEGGEPEKQSHAELPEEAEEPAEGEEGNGQEPE